MSDKKEKNYNDIDGVVILDKPKDFTSNDCLQIIKKYLHPKKIGHTGTLDTNATGVLVCLLGKGTKCQDFLMKNAKKTYEAELVLGLSTDTEDITGNVIETKNVDINVEKLKTVLKSFVGTYEQIPPMYSAKKVNGKKLINLARHGVTVERKASNVQIYEIILLSEVANTKYKIYNIRVKCSKGTYIRTLCKDIGEKLSVPACMGNLRRLESGIFNIKDAIKLDDIKDLANDLDFSFVKPCIYMKSPQVVTFGKFETLHLGHQKLINITTDIAKNEKIESTVLLVNDKKDSDILTESQRISKLDFLGIDNIVEFPFNKWTMKMTPKDFVEEILIRQLQGKIIVVGSDCSFGANAEGDKDLLTEICDKHNVKVVVIDKMKFSEIDINVKYSKDDISSTLIKKMKEENIEVEKYL